MNYLFYCFKCLFVHFKSDLFVTFNYILEHLNKQSLFKKVSIWIFEMWFILVL